jgi:hypothetical protein
VRFHCRFTDVSYCSLDSGAKGHDIVHSPVYHHFLFKVSGFLTNMVGSVPMTMRLGFPAVQTPTRADMPVSRCGQFLAAGSFALFFGRQEIQDRDGRVSFLCKESK